MAEMMMMMMTMMMMMMMMMGGNLAEMVTAVLGRKCLSLGQPLHPPTPLHCSE